MAYLAVLTPQEMMSSDAIAVVSILFLNVNDSEQKYFL